MREICVQSAAGAECGGEAMSPSTVQSPAQKRATERARRSAETARPGAAGPAELVWLRRASRHVVMRARPRPMG
jgi:hypothetical protein